MLRLLAVQGSPCSAYPAGFFLGVMAVRSGILRKGLTSSGILFRRIYMNIMWRVNYMGQEWEQKATWVVV